MTITKLKNLLQPGVRVLLAKCEVKNPQSTAVAGTIVNKIQIDAEGWFESKAHKFLNKVRTVVKYGPTDIIFQTPDGKPSYLSSPKKREISETSNGFTIQILEEGKYGTRLTYQFVK